MKTIDYLEITMDEFARRCEGSELLESDWGGDVWRNPDGMILARLIEGLRIRVFALMVDK